MSGNSEVDQAQDDDQQQDQKDQPVLSKSGRPIYYYSYVRDMNKGKDGQEKDDVGIAEFYQFSAIAAGAVCFFFRFKWAAWLCLLLFYSSVINFKFEHMM